MSFSDLEKEQLITSIAEITLLLKAIVRNQLAPAIERELEDPTSMALFEMTGTNTAREISRATGLSIATISRTWNRWEILGLVTKDGTRYRRVI